MDSTLLTALAAGGAALAVIIVVTVILVRRRQNAVDRASGVTAVFTSRHPGPRYWAVIAAEPVGGTVLVTRDTGAEAVIEPVAVSDPVTAGQRPFRGRSVRFVYQWRPGSRSNLGRAPLGDVRVEPYQTSRVKRRGPGTPPPSGTGAVFGDLDLDP